MSRSASWEGNQKVVAEGSTPRLDAHVHVWSGDEAAYPFGPHDGLAAPVEGFDGIRLAAAMDAAGVAQALAIQSRFYGYDHAYLFAAAAGLKRRLKVVPLLNAVRPSNVEEMEGYLACGGIAGFRVIVLCSEPADWLIGPAAARLWSRLAQLRLPIGLLINPVQLSVVESLAEREPELRIVVDHLGGIDAGVWPLWGPVLLGLSRMPNVHVKLSALGHLSREVFPYEDLHRPVQALLDSYGPERLLWGSDWPHAYEYGTYEQSAQSVAVAIGIGRDAEQDLVFGGTARSLYGFDA